LKQIGRALQDYWYSGRALPYDPKGPEYALYQLSKDLPASCFDAFPDDNPRPEARWDDAEKRLVNSDFEYINRPNVDRSFGPLIVLVEKPQPGYRAVMLLRGDGRITHCKKPRGSARELFDTWDSSDDFLVKGQRLFESWESVPLPAKEEYSLATSDAAAGSIWGTRTIRRNYGSIKVYFDYEGGELIRRTFDSPAGKIIDSVTTDEMGRIIAFNREPDNWQSFWPIKDATKESE
jgi:hypothetical protein